VAEDGTMTLQETVLFQNENAADNHSSFAWVDGNLYVFHQTPAESVVVKVFVPTR